MSERHVEMNRSSMAGIWLLAALAISLSLWMAIGWTLTKFFVSL